MFLIGWPGGSWQASAWLAALLFGAYVAAFWLTLVFWTARDIRQRSDSPAAHLAAPLLVLLGFLPGLCLYLVVRPRSTRAQLYTRLLEEEALRLELDRQVACPACSRPIRDDYLVCPACKAELKSACTSCSKPLANAWVVCPYCGVERARSARRLPPSERPLLQPAAGRLLAESAGPTSQPLVAERTPPAFPGTAPRPAETGSPDPRATAGR